MVSVAVVSVAVVSVAVVSEAVVSEAAVFCVPFPHHGRMENRSRWPSDQIHCEFGFDLFNLQQVPRKPTMKSNHR